MAGVEEGDRALVVEQRLVRLCSGLRGTGQGPKGGCDAQDSWRRARLAPSRGFKFEMNMGSRAWDEKLR